MDNKETIDALEKRVTALESAVMKELKLVKEQNDIIKKLAEAVAAILRKLADEGKDETET